MQVSYVAIHEAGHAVVAAYLRVPFRFVTIRPNEKENSGGHLTPSDGGRVLAKVRNLSWNRKNDLFTFRPKQEIEKEIKRQITNKATMSLGARAALEVLDCIAEETCFQSDEEFIHLCAEHLKVTDFDTWRKSLLARAKEIVSIPHVNNAIKTVAMNLEAEYACFKRGIPAKDVRECLRLTQELMREQPVA